jgi:hypothetical protein
MAMLDEFGPSSAEIRSRFEQAASGGKGYMLEICEMLDDPMLVTLFHSTTIVESEQDIVKALTDRKKASPYADFMLTGVFDLAKSYESQACIPGSDRIKTMLSAETQSALSAIDQARRQNNLQREWDRLPWHQRLFKPKPF